MDKDLTPNAICAINRAIFTLNYQVNSMTDVEKIWALFPVAPRDVVG